MPFWNQLAPLRRAIALQVAALLCAVLAALALAVWQSEQAAARASAGALKVEAEVVALDAAGASVRYRVAGHNHRAWLDDRSDRQRRVGEQLMVELAPAAPDRPLLRAERRGLRTTALALCGIGVAAALLCAGLALRQRRRLPQLELSQPRLAQRLSAAAPDAAFAALFAWLWVAPGTMPREIAEAAGYALLFDAMLGLYTCLVLPTIQARRKRSTDLIAFGLMALLGIKLSAMLVAPGA